MSDPTLRAIDRLTRRGVRLGEARLVERRIEWITVKDDKVERHTDTTDRGMGVRVLNGGWGYAAGRDADGDAGALADRAADLGARAGNHSYGAIDVGSPPPARGEWRSPCEVDPFSIALDEKVGGLIAATRAMRQAASNGGPRLIAKGNAVSMRIRTRFRSTEGSDWTQEQTICGMSIQATAISDSSVQVRTWPKSEEGDVAGRGWEHVRSHNVMGNAPEIASEAIRLTEAPKLPAGRHDLILDGAQLSLQIHESCGHPSEGDRVLGEEMSLAGGSFLQPDRRGMRYGSPIVSLYADGATAGAAGSFGWDDEGTPSARVDIVKDGVFVGWLSGRESASRLGTPNAAAMRADGWQGIPIVRMTNVNLAPGTAGSQGDLIRSTERGFLLSRNRSWSIDQLRLNFQFGCEAAYEIRDGEKVGLYRDPVYTGITPAFWGSCDAICGPAEWKPWGWAFCGKGDPMQIMFVGHGCAPARFRGVETL